MTDTRRSAHTPGPWSVCGDGAKCSCKMVMAPSDPIAKVTVGDWGDDYPALRITGPTLDQKVEAYMEQITYGEVSEEVARANTILIAAAPTMYDYIASSASAGCATAQKIMDDIHDQGAL